MSKEPESIKQLAQDYIDDALDVVSDYGEFAPTVESWESFVDIVFVEHFANNVLPGYEDFDDAMSCIAANRGEAESAFREMVSARNIWNPFENPTKFLVFCVAHEAKKMWVDYRTRWREMWK